MEKDVIICKIKNQVAIKRLEKEIDSLVDNLLEGIKKENQKLKEENLLLRLENQKLYSLIQKMPNKNTLAILKFKDKGIIS